MESLLLTKTNKFLSPLSSSLESTDPQTSQAITEDSAQDMATPSEIFAIVQQLSSQMNGSRIEQVVGAVKSLKIDDIQSIVDLLSIALEKHHHLLAHADCILNLLSEIASSAKLLTRNRTLNSEQPIITTSRGVYTIHDEPPMRVRVIKEETAGVFSKPLITWAHLSHPNILPIYGASLDRRGGPISLISPVLDQTNIVEYSKTIPQVERMALISDVIDGLCYLHQLDITHGSLNPECVFISNNRRAFITDLDGSSQTFTIRYCAPEVLESEDSLATKSADVWGFGCLCYEVLSGNVPFCQYRQEKVVAVVLARKQPIRPGQQGVKGEEINDVTWRPVSACWVFDPENRPSCSKLHDAFASMNTHDNRPASQSPSHVRRAEGSAINLKNIRSILNRVLGSDQLLPPPSPIPDHLRELLHGLTNNLPRAYSVAAAAKKLNHGDIQILLDALDLLVEEDPSLTLRKNPVAELMQTLMTSTHIYPQRYKLRHIRYDPSPIAEDSFGKVYKARDLHLCVNVVTDSRYVAPIFKLLVLWAHSSNPNVLPFYGVFNEIFNEVPRFCVVSPFMKHGTLLEYAPRLPQKSRVSLISDVLDGLSFLHQFLYINELRPDTVLVSDDGRALVATFGVASIVTCTAATKVIRSSPSRAVRFQAPEYCKTQQSGFGTDIWSFGCLCFEVLSGKSPYHQYTKKAEIEFALALGESLKRPSITDNGIEMIDDPLWELITGCCRTVPGDRLTMIEIQKLLVNLGRQDERPNTQKLPGADIVSSRTCPDIEWDRIKQFIGQIQVELLRSPLSGLIQNRIKDVALEAENLEPTDVQTFVDFLDLTLKDHLTISEERNRVLALLSRVMTFAQVFPQRHELNGIKYDPCPIAEGGFGKVHRGSSNPDLCVKVTTRVNDPHALVAYIKELVLWAHSSHPNILPFYGVFFGDSQQICLVSPYMTRGNLSNYSCQLPQSSRIPLLLDTIKGLGYLHGLGIVHTDLKGENVLISDEGRGLITDFGASHIVTASAKGGAATASVTTTLRFAAPEIIRDQTRQVRPSKESDIWSFGCLCYQVLSRKLPYHEFRLDVQVLAALLRGQLPKRPGPTQNDTYEDSDDGLDDFDEKDWDDFDDSIWSFIVKCLVPKPDNRPNASQVEELIVDMKAWDTRPAAKGVLGVEIILKEKSNVEVNLNRAGPLLDHLQIVFLARRLYKYSDQDIVTAVGKLDKEAGDDLQAFWALALDKHLSIPSDQRRILAINSAVIASRRWYSRGYCFRTRPRSDLIAVGEGSFGKVYRDPKLNICVKHAQYEGMDPRLWQQYRWALAPWAHSSHPNILPFYGYFNRGGGFLVSPFIENGSLHSYAPNLPQNSRMLLISDVVEGLIYLHNLGVIHSNLKTQNVLISNEGRGLITDFRPYHVNVAAAADGPIGSYITSTLRFTAPELVQNSQMIPTTASDVWSVGCLFYEVLSRKVPYYQYAEDSEIRAALRRDELPTRSVLPDEKMDEIDDRSWDLIWKCCASKVGSRLKLEDIKQWLEDMHLKNNRPAATSLPGAEVMKERRPYRDIDTVHIKEILDKLEVHLPKVTQEEEDSEHRN